MIATQRRALILHLLQEHGVITVADICAHCNCSPETARRDLRQLDTQGELIRTHGGATLNGAAGPSATSHHLPELASAPSHSPSLIEARIALTNRVDALVVTPSQTRTAALLVDRCRRASIPVIAEALHMPGVHAVVSVDNYQAALEAGRWAAGYARQRFGGLVVALDVGFPQANTETRSRGFAAGLRELPASQVSIVRVNGLGLRSTARQIAADALAVHPNVNVIFGVNDDSALGALDAFDAAGLDRSRVLLVTFGLEGFAAKDLLERNHPHAVGVAMFPELVGRACVDAAICAFHGCAVSECIPTPFAVVTAETLGHYYQRDERSGAWNVNWQRAEQAAAVSPPYLLLGRCSNANRPRRIGYLEVFSSHEWYQNVRRAMQDRCRSLGVVLEVIDASHDAVREVETLKRAIGRTAAQQVRDGDTIILDAGQTTAYLAQALKGRHNITVITNSLRVLAELEDEPGITLVSCGGVVRRESHALVGHSAEATFKDLRVDRAFISVTGLSLAFGLSNTNIPEATVKRAMIDAAHDATVLADSTKIGVESLIKIAPVERVQRLVTNASIAAPERLALSQRGIEVVVAEDTMLPPANGRSA
jgi:DeoR/GlpR family transcriptional regulator of sugar metabolism